MNKYLLEILQETNTIIIPGLGALTVTNKDKGEIMFMSYLKHDDGKLSSYISEKDGVDETEAKNTIAKYVREIQSTTDQGDSFDVFGLGSFVKGPDGEIEFTYENAQSISDTPVTPVIEEKTVAEKEEEEIKETIENTIAEVESKIENTISETIEPKEEKVEEVKEETKVRPLNIAEQEELNKNVEKLDKLKESSPKKETLRKKEAPKAIKKAQPKEKEEKKKRGAGFWILIIVIALLVAGGTYFGLNYNELKQHVPFLADNSSSEEMENDALDKMKELLGEEEVSEDESVDETEVTNEETESDLTEEEIIEEPVQEETEVVEEKQEPTPTPTYSGNTSSGGPYKVVAGVFSSIENANRQVEKFKSEGLPAETFVNSNGLNVVVMKSFQTSEAANAEMSSLKAISSSAWLMYRP